MNGIISFDYPQVLFGFAVFIPLILYDYFSAWKKQIHQRLPGFLRKKLFVSQIFFKIFLACIIIALSGPRWGAGYTALEYRQQGRRAVDTVIALDVSRSMQVSDGPGSGISRLEQGLLIVSEAVSIMPGTRFGVAISRNRGIVTVPLTWDSSAVLAFLDAADSSITGRGTNLESLIDAAASAFQSSNPSTKLILLVSDGESLSGSFKAAVERCKRDGIIISSIATGTDEGGIVPELHNDNSNNGQPHEQSSPGTNEIYSMRDSEALRMAAGQTGGIYIDGNNADASTKLANHLRTLAPGSHLHRTQKQAQARWFIFIILAILSFGASKLSLLKLRK